MSRLFRQTTFLAVVGLAALVGACGDDDNNTSFDARTSDASATTFDAKPADGGGGAFVRNVSLTKAAEVPVCANAGTAAAGDATVTVSADESMITVHMTFSGLSGPATLAHIHAGAAGVMGNVALNFGSNPTTPIDKVFVAADYQNPTGGPANFAAFVTSLKAGNAYLNVHTGMCMGGEVRGQILP